MNNGALAIGNLTRDIAIQSTKNGKHTCSFTLGVYASETHTDFISCVAWEKEADKLVGVKKGSRLFVLGRINTRDYTDKTGRKVYVTEIVASNVEVLKRKEDTPEITKEEEPIFSTDIPSDDLPF